MHHAIIAATAGLALLVSGCSKAPDPAGAERPAPAEPQAEAAPVSAPAPDPAAETPAAAPRHPLNDTGMLVAGNHPRTLSDTCKGVIDPQDDWVMGETFDHLDLPGQDCAYGRDVSVADAGDGYAGFEFHKLDVNGQRLPADAPTWACVEDGVTGLIWQRLEPGDGQVGNQGLADADDRFTWYSTDATRNGGNIGDWNRDYGDCNGYTAGQPGTFCNTQALAERVNATAPCGFDDWRLPTAQELTGIVNYNLIEPAIETAYFPNTQPSLYWTGTAVASNLDTALSVSFGFGATGVNTKGEQLHVRLVRSSNRNPVVAETSTAGELP